MLTIVVTAFEPSPKPRYDFPLFKNEHVKALLQADARARTPDTPRWMPYRDQTLLACFFDLGWRVGEASQARLEHVDFRSALVAIPRIRSTPVHWWSPSHVSTGRLRFSPPTGVP